MLFLLMLPPASVKDCLTLLRFHLQYPTMPLLVKSGTITQGLVEAGVLTPQGFFNPDLEKVMPLLDSPHLAQFISKDAGGRLLTLLSQWEPEDAKALKSILREAVTDKKWESVALKHSPAPEPADQNVESNPAAKAETKLTERQPYAKALYELLRKRPLDSKLLAHGIHSAERPERFIIKIRLDLATRAIIEQANPNDPIVARWHLYQALIQKADYEPSLSELEKAGVEKDSLPALRAHRNRGGLYIIPCQLILHLGKSKLRVAVFSSSTPQNHELFDLMRVVAAQMPLPEGLRLSQPQSKTFQLDGSIALDAFISDQNRWDTPKLYAEIQRIWQDLLHFLTGMDKILTLEMAQALLQQYAGQPLLADDFILITDKAAAALKSYDNELHLNGLTHLSEPAAAELTQVAESLQLDGLKVISDGVAEALASHEGDLTLRGLTHISDASARSLARHRGRLHLDGLTSLPEYTAHALSEQPGDELDLLSLNGITHLSDNAALSLANRKGGLSLQGLTSLSDVAAEALSKQQGNGVDPLRLDGLASLSEAAAQALAAYAGQVQFAALEPKDQQRYETYRQQH
jgi:hypothetical protein